MNGGGWTGDGVTFHFADTSKIQFNSAVKASLSAPRTGRYQGILLYEAAGLSPSHFIMNDSKGHRLEGLIWLPSRDTIFNSGSTADSDAITMVLRTLILDPTDWRIEPGGLQMSGASGGASAYLIE